MHSRPSSSSFSLFPHLTTPKPHALNLSCNFLRCNLRNLCQFHQRQHISSDLETLKSRNLATCPNKPDLVLHHCSTCPARFSQGLTPSYRIASRYGCLILLSTKALGTVMRPTSFSLSLSSSLPSSAPPLLSSVHPPPSSHPSEPLQV